MPRDTCSQATLQRICLHNLKQIKGFDHVIEILVQWRDVSGHHIHENHGYGSDREADEDVANWTVAAVRPRVDNQVLRSARAMIEWLQQTYRLEEPPPPAKEKARKISTNPLSSSKDIPHRESLRKELLG